MNALHTLTSWLHPTTPSRPAATTPAERRKTLADVTAECARFAAASARDAERLASAAADVRQAETQLAAARRRHAELGAEQISRSLTHEWRISSLQAHLRAGAPEFLDRFLMDLDVLTDATRLQFKALESPAGLRDDLTGALRAPAIATNAASVERRLRAIEAARACAEAMKLQPEVAEEAVKATLRELLARLPAVEPPLRETGPLFTPAELREAQWRREEAKR